MLRIKRVEPKDKDIGPVMEFSTPPGVLCAFIGMATLRVIALSGALTVDEPTSRNLPSTWGRPSGGTSHGQHTLG
ncbi:MAG: hypothetical protein J4N99_02935 [Chloroflexi bacterium]|nr:hypothetical protein [Chloroflexota bacterium]